MNAAAEAAEVRKGLEVVERIEGDREATAKLASGDEVSVSALVALDYVEAFTMPTEISIMYVALEGMTRDRNGDPYPLHSFREMDECEAEQIVGAEWLREQVERIADECAKNGLRVE